MGVRVSSALFLLGMIVLEDDLLLVFRDAEMDDYLVSGFPS